MAKEINNVNWNELKEKFTSFNGTIVDFCKENGITKGQFYYYKRKNKEVSRPIFHAIALNKEDNTKLKDHNTIPSKDIKIEIGKANIYIPSHEISLLSVILKELAK